jgi:hypothetical protein
MMISNPVGKTFVIRYKRFDWLATCTRTWLGHQGSDYLEMTVWNEHKDPFPFAVLESEVQVIEHEKLAFILDEGENVAIEIAAHMLAGESQARVKARERRKTEQSWGTW